MTTFFDINQFKAALKNGGARPNQFRVHITFPTRLGIVTSLSSYLVSVAELPGQNIGVTPVYYRGRELKLAGDKVFSPFTCTILNDTDFTLRQGMELWMNLIESNTRKTGATAPSEYQQQIEVFQLDRQGNDLRKYNLNGAFPTDISPIGLDFAANDQLSTFGVTFQYQDFTINASNGGVIA
jgi:hypothetical protein